LAAFCQGENGERIKKIESMILIIQILFILQLVLSLFYLFGFIKLKSGLNNLISSSEKSDDKPPVSVIISLHNEEANISGLITHLRDQNYPKTQLEIIFVDDRSEDNTYNSLKRHVIDNFSVKVIRIKTTPPGYAPKKYAITRAILQAQGEILLFTDADGRPGPDWVSSMVSHFTGETGMVLGYAPYSTNPPFSQTIYRILALEYLSHAAVSAASAGLNYPVTCVGTNLAYRKTVFEQLEGYGKFKDIHTGDDDLFLQRVREETNWSIRYITNQKSHVFNAPPDNLTKFYNQRLRYASKGFLYPLKLNLSLVLLYFYNLLFLTNLVLAIIQPYWFFIYLFALLTKFFPDYFFMRKAAKILHDQRHISLMPFSLFLHIPYVIYFGLAAQIQNFSWAGRRG
jgi:poly-beta-1,6-N-acetyl-D-glucosamine synthase